ncbi:MAG TPA: MFS transporter, partial [Chloroflexia bacterium]|nr:MFS transporter [Chloroflexia bacterium]
MDSASLVAVDPAATPATPFPWARAFQLAVASFGISLIGPLLATYGPIFLAGMGLDATAVGFLSSLDSYSSLLVLPAVAALSDRTRTPIGRRKPFMLAGAALAALACIALPQMRTLPLLLAALVATVCGMALLRGPNASLLGDLFPSARRSQANGVLSLMGGIAWVVAFGLGGVLYRRDPTLP